MSYVLAILIGILLYVMYLPISKWWDECQAENCRNKVAYDPEYDMWFSQHPYHACRRCKK